MMKTITRDIRMCNKSNGFTLHKCLHQYLNAICFQFISTWISSFRFTTTITGITRAVASIWPWSRVPWRLIHPGYPITWISGSSDECRWTENPHRPRNQRTHEEHATRETQDADCGGLSRKSVNVLMMLAWTNLQQYCQLSTFFLSHMLFTKWLSTLQVRIQDWGKWRVLEKSYYVCGSVDI